MMPKWTKGTPVWRPLYAFKFYNHRNGWMLHDQAKWGFEKVSWDEALDYVTKVSIL